jgi:hypothetical protein
MFYQAVLKPLTEAEVNVLTKGQSLTDRMGSESAECPECHTNSWMLLPIESSPVREGGKPYCECLNCGYQTHL